MSAPFGEQCERLRLRLRKEREPTAQPQPERVFRMVVGRTGVVKERCEPSSLNRFPFRKGVGTLKPRNGTAPVQSPQPYWSERGGRGDPRTPHRKVSGKSPCRERNIPLQIGRFQA